MKDPIFWRLVWKEYRIQRGFWIALAVMAVLGQLVVMVFVREGADKLAWLFGLALAGPALFALGCGATLFATEHETETFQFQRSLPTTARCLFIAKLTFALMSTSVLFALLWTWTFGLTKGRLPDADTHLQLWGLFGGAAVELLIWGMFFSLLTTRPLQAAVLGIAAASTVAHLIASSFTTNEIFVLDLKPYLTALPFRVAFAMVIFLVDIRLARRWFEDASVTSKYFWSIGWRRKTKAKTCDTIRGKVPTRVSVLGRLLWQQWRQTGWLLVTMGIVPMVLGFPFALIYLRNNSTTSMLIPLAVLPAALIGSCVFFADQERRRFQFLTEHGVRPHSIWLSRQLVGLGSVLLITLGVYAILILLVLPRYRYVAAWDAMSASRIFLALQYEAFWAAVAAVMMLAAYAAGQLCSMFLRSGILACFFGLVFTGVLCGWIRLMIVLDVNWIWSVVPIPLVLLLATWLRAPDWLVQRNGWRPWLRTGLSLGVPAVAMLIAVPLNRAYQIPLVDPGFSLEEYTRPITSEERATADMYQRATDMMVPMPGSIHETSSDDDPEAEEMRKAARKLAIAVWLDANQESIALMIEASKRPTCVINDPSAPSYQGMRNRISELDSLLIRSAQQLESAGKLEEAFDHYLAALRFINHQRQRGTINVQTWANSDEQRLYLRLMRWAAKPGQTKEQLLAAIQQLDKLNKNLPPPADAIKYRYFRLRRLIAGDPDAMDDFGFKEEKVFRINLWMTLMPWERHRELRLLNVNTDVNLRVTDDIESAISRNESISKRMLQSFYSTRTDTLYKRGKATSYLHRDLFYVSSYWFTTALVKSENHRRAARLLFALQAWNIEHGQLPKTLDELVGSYLDHLPMDPYSGEPYRYFPEGVADSITESGARHRDGSPVVKVDAGQPFIWSTGEKVYIQENVDGETVGFMKYQIVVYPYRGWRRPTSKYEILQAGVPFLIR